MISRANDGYVARQASHDAEDSCNLFRHESRGEVSVDEVRGRLPGVDIISLCGGSRLVSACISMVLH